MNVQAALFSVNEWSTDQTRKWLYTHKCVPLKRVHKTSSFLRYRLIEPNY